MYIVSPDNRNPPTLLKAQGPQVNIMLGSLGFNHGWNNPTAKNPESLGFPIAFNFPSRAGEISHVQTRQGVPLIICAKVAI